MSYDDDISQLIRELEEYEIDYEKAQQETLDKIEEYEKRLNVKDDLIESLEFKVKEQERLLELFERRLVELNHRLSENIENESNANPFYWKGVEETYEKKFDDFLDRIIILEKENFSLELENESLKNKMVIDKGYDE